MFVSRVCDKSIPCHDRKVFAVYNPLKNKPIWISRPAVKRETFDNASR